MPTVVRDIGAGYGRSLVVALVSFALVIPLGMCGILTTVWLVNSAGSEPAVLVLIGILWLIPLAVGVGFLVLATGRRSRKLDALFTPLGLAGSAYMTFFRQYHGTVYGRQVDAYFWRGPFLQVEIPTAIQTRMGITERQSDTSFFAGLAGRVPIALPDPNLSGLTVFADDEAWARSVLSDQTAADAIRRLTALGTSIFTRQQVILRPGAMTLLMSGNRRLFAIDLRPEQVRLWVDDLFRVVTAAETLPPPRVTSQLSSAEELNATLRQGNPYLALWIGLGAFGAIVVVGVVITLIILLAA